MPLKYLNVLYLIFIEEQYIRRKIHQIKNKLYEKIVNIIIDFEIYGMIVLFSFLAIVFILFFWGGHS